MAQGTDRDAEFSAFLADSATSLGQAAWVRTGDRDAATELLQSALVKTYLAWPRVGPAGAVDHTLAAMDAPGSGGRGRRPANAAGMTPPGPDPASVEVPLDPDLVLAEAHNAVRGRRLGWTVAGLVTLAVVASVITPRLIALTVPLAPEPSAAASVPATAPPATASPDPELTGTVWQVAGFDGQSFGKTPVMTIAFDAGSVSGISGCSPFLGSYESGDGRFVITDVSAEADCAAPARGEAQAFLTALGRVRSREAGLNGPLLTRADGTRLVALIPFVPDATTWHLTAADPTATDPAISAEFSGDRLEGTSGCGDYTADLTRDGDRWEVANVARTTTPDCAPAAERRFSRYLARLGEVTTARLDPTSLRLSGPEATLRFTFLD